MPCLCATTLICCIGQGQICLDRQQLVYSTALFKNSSGQYDLKIEKCLNKYETTPYRGFKVEPVILLAGPDRFMNTWRIFFSMKVTERHLSGLRHTVVLFQRYFYERYKRYNGMNLKLKGVSRLSLYVKEIPLKIAFVNIKNSKVK